MHNAYAKHIRIFLVLKTISYPKNISAVKKGKAKKVQVTEWLKGVNSLWGPDEKIYQQYIMYSIQYTGTWQSVKLNFHQHVGAQSPDSYNLDLLPSRNPNGKTLGMPLASHN